MVGVERDVTDEASHGRSSRGAVVGGGVGRADLGREGGSGQRRGAAHEGRRPHGDVVQHPRQACGPDHAGCRCGGGLVHRGVGQDHPRERIAMPQRPTEGDRAAPVVRQQDHGALVEFQRGGQPSEVVDAPCEGTVGAGAFGVAHVEVVRGDHTPALWWSRQHGSEGVGPGRVAVHTQDRADGIARHGRVVGGAVEHVPGT